MTMLYFCILGVSFCSNSNLHPYLCVIEPWVQCVLSVYESLLHEGGPKSTLIKLSMALNSLGAYSIKTDQQTLVAPIAAPPLYFQASQVC